MAQVREKRAVRPLGTVAPDGERTLRRIGDGVPDRRLEPLLPCLGDERQQSGPYSHQTKCHPGSGDIGAH
jgi:hypothetical protein